MPGEWNSEGYPIDYIASFNRPDEIEVEKTAEYIKERAPGVTSIEIDMVGDEIEIWRKYRGGGYIVRVGINWSDPTRSPGQYEEYGRTFWSFYGPPRKQTDRAILLAEKLGIEVEVELSKQPELSKSPPTTHPLRSKLTNLFSFNRQ